MKQWDDKDLDRFLDRTLSEYGQEAPRHGLEQRMLARLAAAPARPRRWWIWAAVPVCAAILIAILLWNSSASKKPVLPPDIAHIPPSKVIERETTSAALQLKRPEIRPPVVATAYQHPTSTGRAVAASTTPRLPTFPSQKGDDELVQLAVRFAQTHPAVAEQIAQEQQEFNQMAAAFTAPLTEQNQQ